MGSSHSRQGEPSSEASNSTSSPSRRRMNPLRRLSTLGRRAKRDRAQSTCPSSPQEKRARLDPTSEEEDDIDPLALERTQTIQSIRSVLGDNWIPPSASEDIQIDEDEPTSTPGPLFTAAEVPLPPRRVLPSGPAPIIRYPVRRATCPDSSRRRTLHRCHPPIWSSSLGIRRRRSIIGIRLNLPSPDLSPSPMSPTALLRRTQSEHAIGSELISPDPQLTHEVIDRRHAAEQEYLQETLALLEEQLVNARRDMERSDSEATRAEERLREAQEAAGRSPGAVLMIQGLAQTQLPPPPRRRGVRWRRERQTGSISEQASMIANLLIVASAATATTLLSTERPPPAPTNMIEDLMRRIRPRRPFSVERTLGDYIASHMNVTSRTSDPNGNEDNSPATANGTTADTTAAASSANVTPAGFTAWLDALQWGITDAMREYAEGPAPSLSRSYSEEPAIPDLDSEPESEVPTPSISVSASRPNASRRVSAPPSQPTLQPLSMTETSHPESIGEGEGPIPTFHTQEGQHRPTPTASASAITTDEHGARHLNFFRAHVFDTGNGQEIPGALVPCVFVGVRSVIHDPAMSTNDLANHPSFPFADGQVPTAAEVAPASTLPGSSADETNEIAPNHEIPSAPTGQPLSNRTRTQALRDRLLALSPFSNSNSSASSSPETPDTSSSGQAQRPSTATYLMYVIGGNYPRNHPVLTMPGLLTGAALSDEEMVLIGELMGQVKPPTATAEEVEQSGLKVIDGSEIQGLVDKMEIIDSSAERCLVCLSDFEKGEECRLLTCRHVFHKECVDQWIKVGRNACPACRSEAVDKAKSKAEPATTTAAAASPEIPTDPQTEGLLDTPSAH